MQSLEKTLKRISVLKRDLWARSNGVSDEEKRERAWGGLKLICQSSEWNATRYQASRELKVNPAYLNDQLEMVIEELGERMDEAHCVEDLRSLGGIVQSRKAKKRISELLGVPEVEFLLEEVKRHREEGHEQIAYTVFNNDELRTLYTSKETPCSIREKAGKELGYSGLRIWMNGFSKRKKG